MERTTKCQWFNCSVLVHVMHHARLAPMHVLLLKTQARIKQSITTVPPNLPWCKLVWWQNELEFIPFRILSSLVSISGIMSVSKCTVKVFAPSQTQHAAYYFSQPKCSKSYRGEESTQGHFPLSSKKAQGQVYLGQSLCSWWIPSGNGCDWQSQCWLLGKKKNTQTGLISTRGYFTFNMFPSSASIHITDVSPISSPKTGHVQKV